MRGYVDRMAGTGRKVLRIAPAAALVVLVAAGCGNAVRSNAPAHGVPRALAREWASRASEIAAVAAAGNSCRAVQLANSLREDVVAAEDRVPQRLRPPLVTGVNALADRLTCIEKVTVPQPPQKPPKKPPDDHGPGHHGHGDDKKDHK
jgi:hypothetical protein